MDQEDKYTVTSGAGVRRRNAIIGAGVREYDFSALEGVHVAANWWSRRDSACLYSGRRAVIPAGLTRVSREL